MSLVRPRADGCCMCPGCRRFTHLKTLNGVQSIACFLWAALLLCTPFARRRKGDTYAPVLAYWKPGISNSIGPALGTEALKNISYPAQVTALRVLHDHPACMLLLASFSNRDRPASFALQQRPPPHTLPVLAVPHSDVRHHLSLTPATTASPEPHLRVVQWLLVTIPVAWSTCE